MKAVVLASRSPQRRALLEGLGIEFEVAVQDVQERDQGDPVEVVGENARRKAIAAIDQAPDGALVIAGDTEVVLDGVVLGQPGDLEAARAMLTALLGRTHEVVSSLCLVEAHGEGDRPVREGVEVSRVTFRELDYRLLDAYLASGEWRGRAGGYAVQGLGSALVERVEGDLSNVIGLPVGLLLRLAPELLEASQGGRSGGNLPPNAGSQ